MAIFIREAMLSPLIELTPAHFPHITETTSLVDFFAPWCPPCMRLLPEVRKAARDMPKVVFGSVDCAAHSQLCQRMSVSSYPTTVMYNSSKPHTTSGYKNKEEILQFIEDVLNPPVIQLDYEQWIIKINNKKADEVWFVDYYAPWCGPCKQLAPTWNKFSKSLDHFENVFVAKVDCTVETQVCKLEGIRGYPAVKVYGAGSKGRGKFTQYKGWGQLNDLQGWAMPHLPSDVETLVPKNFVDKVLKSKSPWLVEFYTPKCGPCQRFAGEMEKLAGKLKERLGIGKVDCNQHYNLCYQAKLNGFPTLYFYPGGTGQPQDIKGVNIETSTADQIHNHLVRHYPFLNTPHRRDEL
ncbi:dnaJ homolog subfamily C member 10-like [Bolinopsis microptera]|uniref:dnaJ homolog subfamily C member 10-like n=1 Tax=Bolinopsis microptera TaxID=2820187 RepID=UPI003079C023